MSWVIDWISPKGFSSNRVAHCKECKGEIRPGERRVTLSRGMGRNARTLYLCPSCAEWQAHMLSTLACEMRTCAAGDYDTEKEFYRRGSSFGVVFLDSRFKFKLPEAHREKPKPFTYSDIPF